MAIIRLRILCLLYEKTTYQDKIKFISDHYLQIYKALQLFTSLITINTNIFASIKNTYLQRHKVIKKLIKAWV